jgi:CheY-like chemotaxis protein
MSWNPFGKDKAPSPAPAPVTPSASAPARPAQPQRPASALDPRTGGKALEILLVEDNPDDVALTIEALHDSKIANTIHVAKDGVEAMDFLHKRGAFVGKPTPDLVFLDLNMPRKSGREVLDEVKNDPQLKHIPIIVLTTSQAEEDIFRSYDLQASAYVVKPVDFERFVNVIKAIDTFWFNAVRYPAHH